MSNPPNKGKGAAIRWIRDHVGYQGDDCLRWPFRGPNGYGVFGYLGKQHYAHRYMCELVKGPPPSPEHEAAHSCGRGQFGCVNPNHLSWKTPGDNQRDRAEHGTRNVWSWRGKITQTQADEIRALKGKKTQAELAKIYGVSRSNISFIHCGKAWTKGPLWTDGGPNTEIQERVVGALSRIPRKIKEIQAATGLSRETTSTVLASLARRGVIERPARALYQVKSH